MRKAQGLSLNMIVIAAIVLIVLIVAVMVFTGYFGKFVPGLQAASERECEGTGYAKTPFNQGCAPDEVQVFGDFGEDWNPDSICCKKKSSSTSSTQSCTRNCRSLGDCDTAGGVVIAGSCSGAEVCCSR